MTKETLRRLLARQNPGFTLIELLIVIVIIGILGGVVIAVINPAQMQRRANETVLRTTVEKGCLALHACAATTSDPTNCDTVTEAGINATNGTPTSSTYCLDTNGATVACDGGAAAAGATLMFAGTLNTCAFRCGYDFTNNVTSALAVQAGSTCSIGAL